MEIKPGKQTTEFWITSILNLAGAILMILVVYGVVKTDEAEMWQEIIATVLAIVVPMAMALTTKEYTQSRTALKLESMQPGAASHRPEAAE